ncbi:hypothetical protein GGQ74_003071 [Desulfobaculum xiamenense]|uniref:Uncharacterized protein n=1 Tax=Desulfobaculum xiamenense TaxID=995050 RepID=A0A846QXL5_9BACT|nr:hypothetical protein [Desulfobaculum xiamenense]NJB69369.1 hypothetical protein [Desulfobaculum xiamenense]
MLENGIIVLMGSGMSLACALLCTERHTTGRVCAVADDLTISIKTKRGGIRRFTPLEAPKSPSPEFIRAVRDMLTGCTVRCRHAPFTRGAKPLAAHVRIVSTPGGVACKASIAGLLLSSLETPGRAA